MPFQAKIRETQCNRERGHGLTQNMSRLAIDGWNQLEQSKNFILHDPSKHHFVKEVKSLTKTIQDLGNPFNCLQKPVPCVLDTKH